MNKERFYIDNCGEQSATILVVLEYAKNEVRNNRACNKVFMVIPNDGYKVNLADIGIEKNVLHGLSIEIISLKSFLSKNDYSGSIVISTWLNDDDIFKIEENIDYGLLVGIPYISKYLELWSTTFAIINLKSLEIMKPLDISSPELKNCFESLTQVHINWSLLHSSDEKRIKVLLKKHKDVVVPEEIFAYLIREKNLKYKRSMELKKWAEDLINGKRVRTT